MKIPLERLWPGAYRWIQILHLTHLLEFKSKVQVMLLISCIISLSYSVAWLMDIMQLSCFTNTPWKEEGLGKFTCLVYLLGGVALAFMFRHSFLALAYYDEDGNNLRLQKERFLQEMQTQTGSVLKRATTQAQKLFGLLSADLGDKVNEHVFRMRRILSQIANNPDPNARRIYTVLVTQMAHHLHDLRQPALEHFEKLIKLSGQTHALREALRKEKHESMVELLTGKSAGVPRTATITDDPEEGLLRMLDDVIGSESSVQQHMCCLTSLCHPREKASDGMPPLGGPPALQRTTSVDKAFSVPTEVDLQDELRPIGVDDRKHDPEKVVLQPLRLVLRWFEKIEPRSESTFRLPQAAIQKFDSALEAERHAVDKVTVLIAHLRGSSFYRCILFGVICSLLLLMFYIEMLHVCWTVMMDGRCHGQLIVPCIAALLRKCIGIAAMICYATSLSIVLWNVERFDAVLQVQEDIHELEDFKRQVDHLNAHELGDEDSGVSLIQVVEKALSEQKRLVNEFFNSGWGGTLPLSTFEQLALDLEAARNPRRKQRDSSNSPRGLPCPRRAYKRLSEDESTNSALGGG